MITTKYGTFEVRNNGQGAASLFIGEAKICEFPKVSWWDIDKIEVAVEQHHELIEKRIKERVKEFEVTNDNALVVMEELMAVLGKKDNGFYASRLKQCINKLKG